VVLDFVALPKALLHDHLDGGLRPVTVLELADAVGYGELPAHDPDALAAWFHQGDSGSLESYLEAFDHTVAVMQTPAAVERVAYEAGVDLAADGVVYAEVRFGPSLLTRRGMDYEDSIEAALAGLSRAQRESGIVAPLIITAMRQLADSEKVAQAASRFIGQGVVGFDLAGPEAGYPADDHLPATRTARRAGLGLSLHAGEGDGPDSVWRALDRCCAQRIGHGVRIIDDTVRVDGEIASLGLVATQVRDQRIPLEVSITSNLHTGIAETALAHPVGPLYRAGFRITLNTDNRLMSGIALSDEYALAHNTLGFTVAELGLITEAAIEAGFGDYAERRRLVREVVRPAYAAAIGA
jgi:adenosine deaminase